MAAIPTDLLDRIRALERQVRALMGSANTRPAMNDVLDGNLLIGDDGQFQVKGHGDDLVHIGQVRPDWPDGTRQRGMVVRRDDGKAALTVRSQAPDADGRQPVQVFDHSGNAVLADDASGSGLARPYIPYPQPTPQDAARWESTSATEWTTLYSGDAVVQHPRLYCLIAMETTGDGGELRLLVNERQVGPTSQTTLLFTEPIGVDYDSPVEFQIQARAANETSSVRCSPRALYGVQS
ncbi:hypothetical protein ACFU99_30225 [Streptomyces sp. NPDC057654]|uniref:hypothetical protein n=1 Tax=Streptomyces sp. NPDC057654 TaxID=3346196 RepID=UPI0036CFC671